MAVKAKENEEYSLTQGEIYEEFGKAYGERLKPARAGLQALFGHEV